MGRLARTLALLALACHLGWAYGFKILSDKNMLAIRTYEILERNGKLDVTKMTDAPFGYLGWKLFDHHVATGGRTIFGFLDFVDRERVVFETGLPWRQGYRRVPPAGAEILEQGVARIGFFSLGYRMMDLRAEHQGSISPEGSRILDRERYGSKPYPLDAEEWDAFIKAYPFSRTLLPRVGP